MNKFKAGDKVETPFGVGIFNSYIDGGFMSGSLRVDYEKVQTGAVYFWNEDDIKPYKTPHEKLIELGFTFEIEEHFIQYKHEKKDMRIIVNTIIKDYGVFHLTDYNYRFVNLELSEILTQYLKELR